MLDRLHPSHLVRGARDRARRVRDDGRRHTQALARPLAAAVGIVAFIALVAPAQADASIFDAINPASWAVDGFKAIIKFIVGDSIDELGRHLVGLLLAVPFVADKHAFPGLNAYRTYVTGGAWAILSLTFVVSAMKYWLAGYSGSGTYEAIQGFVRSCVTIVGLLIFVPAFDGLSRAINALTAALIAGPGPSGHTATGLAHVMSLDSIANGGITMLVTLVAIAMAIVLLVVKTIITALLAVLYVASPLALALYPVEELAWVPAALLRALAAILMFPVVWAICFATFAVLPADVLFPGNNGDLLNTVLAPLTTLAVLVIAFRLPFKVLSMGLQASIAPGIGRGASHVRNVSYVRQMVRR